MYGQAKAKQILKGFDSDINVSFNIEYEHQTILEKLSLEHKIINLEKGHIQEAFSHSSTGLELKKNGKSIKEKLKVIKEKEEGERDMNQRMMIEQQAKINDYYPSEEMDDYIYRGTKHKHKQIPMIYSYEDTYAYDKAQKPPEEDSNHMMMASDHAEETMDAPMYESKNNPLRKYNEYARKYVQSCTDLFLLEILNDTLKDYTEYKLTLEQMATLGF